jgi:hypothetical protein
MKINYSHQINMDLFDKSALYRAEVIKQAHPLQWGDDGSTNVEWTNLYDYLVDRAAKLDAAPTTKTKAVRINTGSELKFVLGLPVRGATLDHDGHIYGMEYGTEAEAASVQKDLDKFRASKV